MLRDIERGEPDVLDAAALIAQAAPDLLLLLDFDWDHDGRALAAFAAQLEEAGHAMPHLHAARPNTGIDSGLDLDRDGRRAGPRDALGFGYFTGQGGMAVLSRLKLHPEAGRDLTGLLWRDAPGEGPPTGFYDETALALLPLSTTAHWDLPFDLPWGGQARLLAWHGSPPVFDGPEDRNGRRARDEALLWLHYLDGALGPPPPAPFVLAGISNLDPADGDGDHSAMRRLLDDPRLTDPQPRGPLRPQAGVNADHRGDPALDTADWDDDGPGDLRVDYILPSAQGWQVTGAGLIWPEDGARHALVWVDLAP